MDRLHPHRPIQANLAPQTAVINKRRFWRRTAIFISCAIVLFCPYPSTTAPAFRIQIVDSSGKPIQRLNAIEEWGFWPFDELSPWVAPGKTDDNGYLVLPRQLTWASLGSRMLCCIGPRTKRTGPSVYIAACDAQHLQQAVFEWEGKNNFWNSRAPSTPIRLVARPVPECAP